MTGRQLVIGGAAALAVAVILTFVPLTGSSEHTGSEAGDTATVVVKCESAWTAWRTGGDWQEVEIVEGFDALSSGSEFAARDAVFAADDQCERYAKLRLGLVGLVVVGWLVIAVIRRRQSLSHES